MLFYKFKQGTEIHKGRFSSHLVPQWNELTVIEMHKDIKYSNKLVYLRLSKIIKNESSNLYFLMVSVESLKTESIIRNAISQFNIRH